MCLHLHTKACKVGALPIEKSDVCTSSQHLLCLDCSSVSKKKIRNMGLIFLYCRKKTKRVHE